MPFQTDISWNLKMHTSWILPKNLNLLSPVKSEWLELRETFIQFSWIHSPPIHNNHKHSALLHTGASSSSSTTKPAIPYPPSDVSQYYFTTNTHKHKMWDTMGKREGYIIPKHFEKFCKWNRRIAQYMSSLKLPSLTE